MRTRRWIWTVTGCILLLSCVGALALGSDYPAGTPVFGPTNWPKGLETLINATNRVWGYWVNQEDVFFYSGNASDLTVFLQDCSRIEGIENRRLILHSSIGEAKSPWEKAGRPCDWRLYVCPKGWHNLAVL